MHPRLSYVLIGDDVSVHCNSSGNTKWFFNGKLRNISPLKESDNVLEINNIKMKDAGKYYCYGLLDTINYFVAYINVNVIGEN